MQKSLDFHSPIDDGQKVPVIGDTSVDGCIEVFTGGDKIAKIDKINNNLLF